MRTNGCALSGLIYDKNIAETRFVRTVAMSQREPSECRSGT